MRVMAGLSATAASLLMFGLAVPSALAAQATTLYVDQASAACSDQGSGTQAAPFCTIQAAADIVSPGQTVEITPTGAQRYIQPVTITRSGTAQQPITFTSASAGR